MVSWHTWKESVASIEFSLKVQDAIISDVIIYPEMHISLTKILYIKDLFFLPNLIYFLGPFYPICLCKVRRWFIFKVTPTFENVHCSLNCNLRDNLPSSFRKNYMYVFSQWSLFPSYHNHIYHRCSRFRINTLKLEKIVYWTDRWWCELVILENLDNNKRLTISFFFLLNFLYDL